MNKQQFLAAVGDRLKGLPQSDIDRSLDYYREMIDDRIEDGLSEEEAAAAMGSPENAADQILMDTPLPKLVKAKARLPRKLRGWEIFLLALGSPVWAPLLLAAVIVLLAVYIVIWSVIVSLYAADFSFAVGGVAGVAGSPVLAFTAGASQSLLLLGAGLICAGIAVLLFFASNKITWGVIRFSRQVIMKIKYRFIKKKEVK